MPEPNKEILKIANIVLRDHNMVMIQMLNNSIKFAKNKHEKRAYQNVIDYLRGQEQERIKLIEEPSKEEKQESKIILLK